MRRKFIILAITLTLVISIQIGASAYTRAVVRQASPIIVDMERSVRDGDWTSARSQLQPLSAIWNEACLYMDWWITRAMTDRVHSTLRELEVMLDANDSAHSLLLLAQLRDGLDDVAGWGELTLSNVV